MGGVEMDVGSVKKGRGYKNTTYLQRIVVKLDIPHSGRRIQRFPRLTRIHKPLLRRRMGTHQRRQIMRREALSLKQRNQIIRRVICVGQQSRRRRPRGILAADVGAYPGALGARDGGVVVRVLREVCVADLELGLDFAEEEADRLEAVVLWAVDLAKVHHEGAVGAARGRVLVPGAGVVEAKADGGAGVVVAQAVGFFELFGEFGGDVPPWWC